MIDTQTFVTKQFGQGNGKEAIEGSASLLAMLRQLEIYFENVANRFSPHLQYDQQ